MDSLSPCQRIAAPQIWSEGMCVAMAFEKFRREVNRRHRVVGQFCRIARRRSGHGQDSEAERHAAQRPERNDSG